MITLSRLIRMGAALLVAALIAALVLPASPAAAQPAEGMFMLRQWASSATATSQYQQDGWDAAQAAGQPDTLECNDRKTAWASETRTGQDALTVMFDVPVIPSEVNIYQNYGPGAITGVELVLADGNGTVPVPNSADPGTECPGVFSLPITGVTVPVNGAIITLDQTLTGDWNEIDAVELVGEATVGAEVAMWATYAFATSAYGSGAWDPLQATSAPDVPICGDSSRAWASASANGQDSLTVFFAAPIIARQLDIQQTYTPGSIVSVDLVREDYSSVPVPDSADPGTECPGVFSLSITESAPIIGAVIHLDQSESESWNEIDAVQVTGTLAPVDPLQVAQWASSATATSEYGTAGWSAMQATGLPNSLVCGDQMTAWASARRQAKTR